MKFWIRSTLSIVGLLVAGSAAAVTMSANGSGQVLIYPYYTINAGQQSALTVSNTTDKAKAIKLMIRGGVFGRASFALNVYLGAHDTWTGTLFQWGDGAAAGPALLSNDVSCTVPDLHAADLPTVPGGRHYLRPNASTLSIGAVPKEGYIVAIEMGELNGDIGTEVGTHLIDGSSVYRPPDCSKPIAAWQPDGIWRKDASTDISAPTGGLSGNMTITNASEGTIFRFNATALKDFRVAAMHTAPDATLPDLGDALSDSGTGVASATIRVGDKVIQSDYPADRTIDAVSAVLMAQQLDTNYDYRSGIGASTAFVVSMPTKRFYVADLDHITPPFGRDTYHQTSLLGTLCPIIDIRGDGRDGLAKGFYPGPFLFMGGFTQAEGDVPKPCYATSVLAANNGARPYSLLGSTLRSTIQHTDAGSQLGPAFLVMNYYNLSCYASPTGYCYPRPTDYTRAHINIMRPDLAGRQYFGLPVIGFAATGYINAYAGKAGVFRNFTFAVPYGRSRACVQNGVVGGCH